MKNSIQKTAIAIIALTATLLVPGNVLMAEDRPSGNLITAADLAFIQEGARGIVTPIAAAGRIEPVGMISAADYAFVARAFHAIAGRQAASTAPERVGLISIADYRFIAGEEVSDIFAAYNDLSDSLAGGVAE